MKLTTGGVLHQSPRNLPGTVRLRGTATQRAADSHWAGMAAGRCKRMGRAGAGEAGRPPAPQRALLGPTTASQGSPPGVCLGVGRGFSRCSRHHTGHHHHHHAGHHHTGRPAFGTHPGSLVGPMQPQPQSPHLPPCPTGYPTHPTPPTTPTTAAGGFRRRRHQLRRRAGRQAVVLRWGR